MMKKFHQLAITEDNKEKLRYMLKVVSSISSNLVVVERFRV